MNNLIGLLIVGTGSMYLQDDVGQWKNHLEHRCFFTTEKSASSTSQMDIRTPKEHLENIRSTLNPPIAELANLFEVSRQSVYKWLTEDSCPENDKFDSIKTLSRIADTFKHAGILRTGILLNMKNSQGISLFDLLKAKQPYEEQIKMLIAEARIMETSYQRSGLVQSNAKATDDWMSSISIPAYPEDL